MPVQRVLKRYLSIGRRDRLKHLPVTVNILSTSKHFLSFTHTSSTAVRTRSLSYKKDFQSNRCIINSSRSIRSKLMSHHSYYRNFSNLVEKDDMDDIVISVGGDNDKVEIEKDLTIINGSKHGIDIEGKEEESKLHLDKLKQKSKWELKAVLKQYRREKIEGTKKPLYEIFTNAVIDDICSILPTTKEELLQVRGIGPKKMTMFGDEILLLVSEYLSSSFDGKSMKINVKNIIQPQLPPQPIEINPKTLTHEQRRAANFVLGSDCPNIFITGPAGTGKSYLLKFLVQEFKKRQSEYNPIMNFNDPTPPKIGVVAPTGVAAVNVGGTTLHSYFGIGLGRGSISNLLKRIRKNKTIAKRINETEVLIVDECSMLSSDLLEVFDTVSREIRNDGEFRDIPFGGMQIICFGDFYQLPPIPNRDNKDRNFRPFCFDSPIWSELGLDENVIELQDIQRQENKEFIDLLNKIRIGGVGPTDLIELNSRCLISESHPIPTDGIIPTKLHVLNKDVDSINEFHLAELGGDEVVIKAVNEWKQPMPNGTPIAIKKAMSDSLSKEMPDEVRLKVGAQVMLTRNKNLEKNLVNGSRGVVIRLEKGGTPLVRFDCGIITSIPRVECVRYNPDGGEGCLVRTQIPLKLAWAVTIHKSQGTTLSRVLLDISKAFEYGQCYVALSRVKNLEGLWLESPANLQNIKVSPQVTEFFKHLPSSSLEKVME